MKIVKSAVYEYEKNNINEEWGYTKWYDSKSVVWVEWVKRIRIRFWDSIFHSYFVKILANPSGLSAFLPHLSEKYLITKFCDLKWMRVRGILFVFDCR